VDQKQTKSVFRVFLSDVSISKGKKIKRNQILSKQSEKEFLLNFDGFLMVTYRKKPDESYVAQFFDSSIAQLKQRSLLSLNRGEVVLKNNGRMELPGVSTFGYWYWERIGDLLPENFDPKSNNL